MSFLLLQSYLEIGRCIQYQKIVVSYICNMLNIIYMVFWILVDCKFSNGVSLCFHNGTMILLLLQSYLEINFMYVNVYQLLNKIVFYHFHVLNLFINVFWFQVEWKFFKIEYHCIFQSWMMILYTYKTTWKLVSYSWMYIKY